MLQIPGMMMSPAGQTLFKHAVEHELYGIWAEQNATLDQMAAQNPKVQQARMMGAQVAAPKLPPPGSKLPPEMENEYAKRTAQAMQRVVEKIKALVPMPPGMTDPAMIQAQTNATEVKLQDERDRIEIALKAKQDAEATALKAREHADKMALEYEKLTTNVEQRQVELESAAREGAFNRLTTMATKPQQQRPAA